MALKQRLHKILKQPIPIIYNVLIVCGGERTASEYIQVPSNKDKRRIIYKIEKKRGGLNLLDIVDTAIDLMVAKPKFYNSIWVIFDKNVSRENQSEAIRKALDNNICCSWSEISEVQDLLHFCTQRTNLE